MSNLFDAVDPTLFRSYIFWCAVLVLKMLVMSFLTGMKRDTKKIYATTDDAKMVPGGKVMLHDSEVERVRRAHLNDLENIPPFFVVSFVYMFTGPSVVLAINLFRIFALARIAHTLVYAVFFVPQPARGVAWMTGYLTTIYMAVKTMLAFL